MISIWNAKTGQMIAGPFKGHLNVVFSVAFSPDGKWVVSGSGDATICIWDAETGQIVAGPFEGHTDKVSSVAFSPDGKQVVSGSHDNTIRIWDVKASPILSSHMQSHFHAVTSIGGGHVLSSNHIRNAHGWVSFGVASDASFAFWVPPTYQGGLCGMETLVIFGKHTTRLDLSQLAHGMAWTKCHSPSLGVIQSSVLATIYKKLPMYLSL